MKENIITIISLFLISFNSTGQLNTVENIRAYYAKINQRMADAVKYKTGMYCNEVIVNKTKSSWPGSGNYQKKISLWYSGDPASSDTERPEGLLEKVTAYSEIAGEKYAEEYLFYNGQLIFYYQANTYKENGMAGKDEHRIYFYKEKLIYYDVREGGRKITEEIKETVLAECLRQSKNLVQLFLISCG